LGSNPFGPEYQAQAIGVLRDARARQYNAAVTQLQQQYAAAGRQLDPRLLLVLRQQMATEENADLRESMMDTATKRFGADQSYVNQMGDTVSALDRILSNTQLQPDPSELAFLQSLYRNSGGFYGRKMG
jgi:chromosome condensin MukBEF ATPase and DNA-binding subunit MukB